MNRMDVQMAIYSMVQKLTADGDTNMQQIQRMILKHAAGATAVAATAGVLPAAGDIIALLASNGLVFKLYYDICLLLDLRISDEKLKVIASAVVGQMLAFSAVSMLARLALLLVPGIGVIGGAALNALLNFGLVYASGNLFLILLAKVFKADPDLDFESWSADDFKRAVRKNISLREMFAAMRDAVRAYIDSCAEQPENDEQPKDDKQPKDNEPPLIPDFVSNADGSNS